MLHSILPLILCTFVPLNLWTFVSANLCTFEPLDLWIVVSLSCWTFDSLYLWTFVSLNLWSFVPLILWIKIIQERGLRKRGIDFQFSVVWLFSLDLTIRIQVSKFVQLYYNYTINFLVVILAVLHSIVPWNLCTFISLYLCTFVSLDLWISELLDLSRSRIQDSGIGIESSRKRLSHFNCISIISWFNHCNSFNCNSSVEIR